MTCGEEEPEREDDGEQWGVVGGGEQCRKASGLEQETKKPLSLVKGSQTILPAPGPFIAPTGIHSAPPEACGGPKRTAQALPLRKDQTQARD